MCKQLNVSRAAYYKWLHREIPEQEMENIRLSPNSTYYTISKNLLDDYQDEIYEKIMDSDNVMSYDDYMDDLKERSLGI